MSDFQGLPSKRIVDAVLFDVNQFRRNLGLAPVQSLLRGRSGPDCCPVARTAGIGLPQGSIQVGWAAVRLKNEPESLAVPLSMPTRYFIEAFDNGVYPRMVLR